MKQNYLKISFILVISLILLAGCKGSPGQTEQPKAPPALESITCDTLKTKSRQDECRAAINSVAINILSSEILETFDLNRCKETSNLALGECEKYITETGVQGPITDSEVIALSEATKPDPTTNTYGIDNITKCMNLSTPGLKEYCEKQVNKLIEREAMLKIIQSGDAKRCDELKNDENKQVCKTQLGVITEETTNTTQPAEPANPPAKAQ